ncbi:MAG: dockerin type I domain-containing protein [Euryarchaeota archaeon]|nr:dockerin type I domain-containing protein [Euryarchaeota archaeon]
MAICQRIACESDLNHGNRIADAAIALQLAASGGWDADADVNRDNRITSLDALMILQAAGGAIEL